MKACEVLEQVPISLLQMFLEWRSEDFSLI